MPTLQDVAKRAGVSTATVSKVLSNTPYFTEETRQKVMAAVEELGYRPNLAARALSSGKTHTLAVVFPRIYDTIFQDPLVMQILEGIELVATFNEYNLLLSTPRVQGNSFDKHYHQLIQSGYVEGVITIDNVPQASAAHVAESAGIPTVVIGWHDARFVVRHDDYLGGSLQMRHVCELGHRSIGIIALESRLNLAVNARLQGLRDVATEFGLDFDQMPTVHGDFSEKSGVLAAESLLSEHPEITAIISVNDRMALGAIKAAQPKRSVPDNLTVVGYDDIPVSAVYSPPLTTINQQAVQLGQSAARMMFEVLNNKKPSPVVIAPSLKIRGTSAPPHIHVD